jgi:hypothetical protein
MGAWGTGYFEDDAALDFMADVEESRDPKRILTRAFDNAIKAQYIESHEGTAVIVAAAYVDRQTNGTTYSKHNIDPPLQIDTFPSRNPDHNFSDLREKAVEALNKILGENSEINELWAENDEDYPTWKSGLLQLIMRLTT